MAFVAPGPSAPTPAPPRPPKALTLTKIMGLLAVTTFLAFLFVGMVGFGLLFVVVNFGG